MKHALPLLVALALSTLFAANPASAQPRESVTVDELTFTPVEDVAGMSEWLQRLVGRYKFDGMIEVGIGGNCPPMCEPIKGLGDCVPVGKGPGVQCIFNATWQDLFQVNFESGTATAPPGAVAYLDPAMLLFGIDPGAASINNLLVNDKGLPEGGLGSIVNITSKFTTACVNESAGCLRVMRIEAKPEANLIYMWVDAVSATTRDPITRIILSLRRVAQTDDEEAPTLKRPARAARTAPPPSGQASGQVRPQR
jgi:hypothetical protein